MNSEIDKYYNVARHSYLRWGGPSQAVHFGYYQDDLVSTESQPEDVYQLHLESLRQMAEFFGDFAQLEPGMFVIDAGCGNGGMFGEWDRQNVFACGLNIVTSQLVQAKDLERTATLVQANYNTVPFGANTVDRVVFFESLNHSDNLDGTLSEAVRLLKPGGKVVIADLFSEELDPLSVNKIKTIDSGMALKVRETSELLSAIKSVGFDTVDLIDITQNVAPSVRIAANSARNHTSDETVDVDISGHRQAIIVADELVQEGRLKYCLIRGEKL